MVAGVPPAKQNPAAGTAASTGMLMDRGAPAHSGQAVCSPEPPEAIEVNRPYVIRVIRVIRGLSNLIHSSRRGGISVDLCLLKLFESRRGSDPAF